MAKNKAFEIAVLLTAQDKMSRAISAGVNKSVRQLENLERSTYRFGRSSLRAGLAAGAALAYPAKSAADFESLMSNVETLVDSNVENMARMGTEILNISERVPKPVNEIAEALYNVRSAGVAAGDAMEVTEQSGRLAVAGLSTVTESVNIMTSAYNAFKNEGLSASEIADILFKTVKAGKTTISELSQGFGANAAVIESAGVRLADYQAATAALTTVGIPASQAQAGLRASVVSLLKPTADMQKLFEALGVKDGPELIKTSGSLGNAFVNIANAAEAMDIELVKATGRVEGATAIASVAGATNEVYTNTLYDMVKGAQAVDTAFDKQAKTVNNQFQVMRNQVTAMAIDVGRVLNPQLIALFEDMKPVVAGIRDWIEANPKLTGQIVKAVASFAVLATISGAVSLGMSQIFGLTKGLVKGFGLAARAGTFLFSGFSQGAAVLMRTGSVVKGLTAGMRALNLAFLANPIGIAIAAGIALGIVFDQLWKKSETFRGVLLGSWEVIKGFGNILKTFVIDRITGIVEGLGLMGKAIYQLFSGDFKGAAKSALSSVKNVSGIQAAENAIRSGAGLGDKFQGGYQIGVSQVRGRKLLEESQSTQRQVKDAPAMPGGGSTEVNYSPSIQISGPVSQAQEQAFTDQLQRHKEEIVRIIEQAKGNDVRVSFG